MRHRTINDGKEEAFTTKAQRTQSGKDARQKRRDHEEKRAMICGLLVLDLGPLVRVVRGHKGKMLTTEITEDTE
jgi:hypothetical protein